LEVGKKWKFNLPFMPKILFISHTSAMGGPANSLLKLIKTIRHTNAYQVEVFLRGNGEFVQVLKKEAIPCRVFPFRRATLPWLVFLIWKGRYDLVYGNNLSGPSILALIATKFLGKPFIWHIREIILESRASRGTRAKLRWADAIIAVSRASAASVQPYYPGRKVNVVYNGIEVNEFSLDKSEARARIREYLGVNEENILVAVVGNICERKNQKDAMEVACRLIPRFPALKFCFLGRYQEPEYVNVLKGMAAQKGITEAVFFPGFQSNVSEYYRAADILLHTPVKDPHPRAVLEGMAAELPVIAYGVDGVPETVESGVTGCLASFGDIDALQAGVEKLVLDARLRQEMGQLGRQRVEQLFTAGKTSQAVLRVIEDVLEKRTGIPAASTP
jgi:glycosyltransferase involved in cell wall biosynthesis